MYARRCLVLVVALALGGCTPGPPPPSPSAPPPAASAPPPSGSSSSASSASPAQPSPAPVGSPAPSGAPLALTIYGIAHPGEKPGCVILTATDNRVYLLLGGDRQIITAGGQLAVTGHVVPGLLNAECRDGIPFEVSSVRPD